MQTTGTTETIEMNDLGGQNDRGSQDQSPPEQNAGDAGDYLKPLPLIFLFLATSLTGSFVMMYALIIATVRKNPPPHPQALRMETTNMAPS
jgi:hypothetical protein